MAPACVVCECAGVYAKRGPVEKFTNPKMMGPPPPSPPQRASNLRPRDETPVHYQYATLSMWCETPPLPPAAGDRQTLGGLTKHPPAPHQHQHAHRAACAVASTSREDAAHCGAGPPCTFRYAPIPYPITVPNND